MKSKDEVISELSEKLGISKQLIKDVYGSYWDSIADGIKMNDLTDLCMFKDDFKKNVTRWITIKGFGSFRFVYSKYSLWARRLRIRIDLKNQINIPEGKYNIIFKKNRKNDIESKESEADV